MLRDTGPAENEEAQRPRFTPRALLDLRDLLRHFQEKAEQAPILAAGTQEQPQQTRVAVPGDESCSTVHDG
jgi:hypothetical protein